MSVKIDIDRLIEAFEKSLKKHNSKVKPTELSLEKIINLIEVFDRNLAKYR